MIFYTYIYLDPRKSGLYQYGDYTFNFEPFYVGKGHGYQDTSHLRLVKNNNSIYKDNSYKISKIKEILNEGLEPYIIRVEDNITEQEAFELEIWLIWAIGRRDLKLGPLMNLIDGGLGFYGQIFNEGYRDRMKIATTGKNNGMYGKNHSKETKKKLSDIAKKRITYSFTGRTHTYETKNILSKIRTGRKLTKETIEKMRQSTTGSKHSEETKQKIGNVTRGRILKEETKQKIGRGNVGKKWTQEQKDKLSKSRKGRIPWNKDIHFKYSDEDRIRLYSNRYKSSRGEND